MQSNQINVAIQLLPLNTSANKYELVDCAIDLIKTSGLNYLVCPFETVIEGTYEQIFELINQIRIETLKNDCQELIINIKIHAAQKDVSIDGKLEKYK